MQGLQGIVFQSKKLAPPKLAKMKMLMQDSRMREALI
jgi:hypothetical protein